MYNGGDEHPNHGRELYARNLWCAQYQGRCALCDANCCIYKEAQQAYHKAPTEQCSGLAKHAGALIQRASSFEEESTFLACCECQQRLCPACVGRPSSSQHYQSRGHLPLRKDGRNLHKKGHPTKVFGQSRQYMNGSRPSSPVVSRVSYSFHPCISSRISFSSTSPVNQNPPRSCRTESSLSPNSSAVILQPAVISKQLGCVQAVSLFSDKGMQNRSQNYLHENSVQRTSNASGRTGHHQLWSVTEATAML